jgi:alkyl hydroperoxide reductase subunit F
MSLSCHNCPDVVQALSLMAIFNPKVKTVVIEGGAFQQEVTEREIMAVPMVFLNGKVFGSGRMSVEEIVAKIDTGAAHRDAAKINAKEDFDVLIVGGGPAGAAAAVYAARKGIRVGIAAERFGGQVNDTMAIENYISVLETDGPKFGAAMEAQVRHYGVDIMNLQKAAKVIPATEPGGLIHVQMENGGVLNARTVILSTGARWRNVNVPGEQTYKNKGVAYCPHCDGPLFKGKRTAVIGGGNSGIEAAIDLAGIVAHVTVIEFADQLKADAVLVNKLKSLNNVTIHTNAQTTEITGDGSVVNGIRFKDRASGEEHHVALEGVFVQIGLIPNTEFLKDTLELSKFGEIVVDAKGHTNVPGVFAAGDCTTVPFKQIVIAAGDGLNDGPVLAGADVSFALGQALPLAQSKADFVLMASDLKPLVATFMLSRKTFQIVKQNLVWAAVYNFACVPLAMLGYLPAWLAGLGMACSSLGVVINAMRLSQTMQFELKGNT